MVASLIHAGTGAPDNIGIRGAAPLAPIYVFKVDQNGGPNCLWTSQAIDYATYDLGESVSIIQTSYSTGSANSDSLKSDYEQRCPAEKISVSNAVADGRFFSAAA
jgi:hypothetical protein